VVFFEEGQQQGRQFAHFFLNRKLGMAFHDPEPHFYLGKIRIENKHVASEWALVRVPVTLDPIFGSFVEVRSRKRIGHAEAQVVEGNEVAKWIVLRMDSFVSPG